MPHALEVRGNIFQNLALIRADLAELVAAACRTDAWRVMRNRLERQMIRQRHAAGRFAGLRRSRRWRLLLDPRVAFGVRFLNVADHQFKLLDLGVALFRRAAEPSAPQHGELHFQLFDEQRLGAHLGGKRRKIALQCACEAAQSLRVFRQICGRERHAEFIA